MKESRKVTEETKLTASDGASGDRFGWSVSLSRDTAVVGAPEEDEARSKPGFAYVFVRSGTTWIQQAKLSARDADKGDAFGCGVSVDRDTVIVGACGDNYNSGSAYVFVRSGTAWTQEAKLTASDRAQGDFFGRSVSLSGDTVVVGADQLDDYGEDPGGCAYVFVRSGTTWTEQAKLTAIDRMPAESFGYSVSLSGDTVVVGARHGDDGSGSAYSRNQPGLAYVFVRSGTTWTQQARLSASDGVSGARFGVSVSLSGDTVVVGANGAYRLWPPTFRKTSAAAATAVLTEADTMPGSGAAYAFVRSGTAWTEQAKLTASDRAASEAFGWSVSLSRDTVVVGAFLADDAGTDSGSAYVFPVSIPGKSDS